MNKPLSLVDKIEATRQHYNALIAASHPARRTDRQQAEIYAALSEYEWLKWELERRESEKRMRKMDHV